MKKIITYFILLFSFTIILKAEAPDSLKGELFYLIENDSKSKKIDTLLNRLFSYYRYISPQKNIEFNMELYEYALINDYTDLNKLVTANLGIIYREQGMGGIALDFLLESLRYTESVNDFESQAWLLIDIGNIYFDYEAYNQALEYYMRSLDLFQGLIRQGVQRNMIVTNYDGVAVNYNNIGLCYRKMENPRKALGYHFKSIEYRKKVDNYGGVAHGFSYIARLHDEMENRDSAMYYYNKALDLLTSKNSGKNYDKQFNLSTKVGVIREISRLKLKNDPDEALSFLQQAENIVNKHDLRTDIIDLNFLKARIYDAKGAENQVISILTNTYDYAMKNNLHERLQNISDTLYKYHSAYGNTSMALKYLEQSKTFSDSTFKQLKSFSLSGIENKIRQKEIISEIEEMNNQKAISEAKLADQRRFNTILVISLILIFALLVLLFYLYHYKNKINKLLKVKNQELFKSQQELQELNETKDKFFSIIAHDLKSPIGAVKNISEVLHLNFNNFEDDEKKSFIEDMSSSLMVISKLLDNLLTWSRSQRDIIIFEPEEINLHDMVESSRKLLLPWSSEKNITVINNIPKAFQIVADNEMMKVILRNLISNGIKYTHRNGFVKVSALAADEYIEISVEDNGIGVPDNLQKDLFRLTKSPTRHGTASESGTGLGLVIINEFIIKHNGEINLKSTEGEGSKFFFKIPREFNTETK